MLLTGKSGQSVDFYIPENYKKVSVNCSGGADSAILLLITVDYLMKENRDSTTLSVKTCSNHFKDRWNGRKAAEVINWVIERTGYENFDMHYTYYRDVQDEGYFSEVERDLYNDNRIDCSINGLTANPISDETTVEDIHGNVIDLMDEALPERMIENVKAPAWFKPKKYHHYAPFQSIDKRFVADMYELYDAMELFELTRSCEAVPDPDMPFDPNFENEPCGECWWCLERKWAFGRF